ncbi:RNA polymerase sigma factor [Candidatus Xianfuyuplasma coldseepsis]|uniref:RNA polymerase sigma factor n=1 Tax=Candidatus Xianfuyuplasma coldseepsis TaxID=2782163 RepID=A0A7L7KRD2_9MOLU|nr:RNA polymerase sigma factor [Xianfuyuplasma coldseepsis]QMS85293.1 RNA polymerase sigma factor [Xianfuyuplasma coldseepsis]
MNSKYSKKDLKISDKLIQRVAQYDAIAFEELYEQASGAVFGLAMSILGNYDDASDVVQSTFISIYEHAKDYRPNKKAMAWIFTIARNHAYSILRQQKKHQHVNLDDVYDIGEESTVEDDVYKENLVTKLLHILNEDDRQIVVMHAMSNMKHKDIAKTLNLPLSTVLSKYRRALKKLQQHLEVNDDET